MDENVGDVSIGVNADMAGFGEEVVDKATVTGDEAGAELARTLAAAFSEAIKAELLPALEEMKLEIKAGLADLKVKPEIEPEVKDEVAKEEVRGLKGWIDRQIADIKVRVNTDEAKAQLATLRKQTLLGGLGATLGPGAAPFAAVLAPAQLGMITAFSAGFGALADLALNASQGILGVASSVEHMVPVAAMLPALITSAGGALAVFKIALAGAKTQLADLKPVAHAMATSIQSSFWNAASGVRTDFLAMRGDITTAFDGVAKAEGTLIGDVANSIRSALGPSGVQGLFAPVAKSIGILDTAVKPVVTAFIQLAQWGSGYLPAISQYIATIATNFSKWVSGAIASGQMTTWLQHAVVLFGALKDAVKSAMSIIQSAINAAVTAGTGGIMSLAGLLNTIATIMAGPQFQGTLVSFFKSAGSAAADFAVPLKDLGNMFTALQSGLGNFIAGAGSSVATILDGLIKALSQPVVNDGLTTVIGGISAAAKALAPVLPAVVRALAPALPMFGTLIGTLGQLIASVLKPLAPAVQGIMQAILKNFLPLANALTKLGPGIGTLAATLIGGLTPFIPTMGKIISGIGDFIGVLLKIINPIMKMKGVAEAVVGGLLAWKIASMGAAVATLIFGDALDATPIGLIVLGIAALVAGIILLVTHWKQVTSFIQTVWKGAVNLVKTGLTDLKNWWDKTWNGIVKTVQDIWKNITGAISKGASDIGKGISDVFSGIGKIVSGAISFIVNLAKTGFTNLFNGIMAINSWIQNAIGVVWNFIGKTIGDIIKLVVDIFTGQWGKIPALVASWFGLVVSTIMSLFGGVVNWIAGAVAAIVNFFVGAWNTVSSATQAVWNAVVTWVAQAITNVLNFIGSLPGKVLTFMEQAASNIGSAIATIIAFFEALPGRVWAAMVSFAAMILRGVLNAAAGFVSFVASVGQHMSEFVSTISTKIGEGVAWFMGLPGRIISAVGNLGSLLVHTGEDVINGLIRGITNSIGKVASVITGGMKSAVNSVKSWLGIASPSKRMRDEVGEMMGQGVIVGIQNMVPQVKNALTNLVAMPTMALTGGTSGASLTGGLGYSPVGGGASSSTSSTNWTINLGGVSGVSNPEAAATAVVNKIARRVGLK